MPTGEGGRRDSSCRREGTPVADTQDAGSRLSALPRRFHSVALLQKARRGAAARSGRAGANRAMRQEGEEGVR